MSCCPSRILSTWRRSRSMFGHRQPVHPGLCARLAAQERPGTRNIRFTHPGHYSRAESGLAPNERDDRASCESQEQRNPHSKRGLKSGDECHQGRLDQRINRGGDHDRDCARNQRCLTLMHHRGGRERDRGGIDEPEIAAKVKTRSLGCFRRAARDHHHREHQAELHREP